jgi:hypothetical protein
MNNHTFLVSLNEKVIVVSQKKLSNISSPIEVSQKKSSNISSPIEVSVKKQVILVRL